MRCARVSPSTTHKSIVDAQFWVARARRVLGTKKFACTRLASPTSLLNFDEEGVRPSSKPQPIQCMRKHSAVSACALYWVARARATLLSGFKCIITLFWGSLWLSFFFSRFSFLNETLVVRTVLPSSRFPLGWLGFFLTSGTLCSLASSVELVRKQELWCSFL